MRLETTLGINAADRPGKLQPLLLPEIMCSGIFVNTIPEQK